MRLHKEIQPQDGPHDNMPVRTAARSRRTLHTQDSGRGDRPRHPHLRGRWRLSPERHGHTPLGGHQDPVRCTALCGMRRQVPPRLHGRQETSQEAQGRILQHRREYDGCHRQGPGVRRQGKREVRRIQRRSPGKQSASGSSGPRGCGARGRMFLSRRHGGHVHRLRGL